MNDGEKAVAVGDVADDELERGQVVGGDQRVGVLEVDLVLARGHFVMGGLDLEAHRGELLDDDAADLLAAVERAQIEIRPRVVRRRRRRAVGRALEQEELRLAPRHHRVTQLPRPIELALERGPGAPRERLLIGRVDVAEEPGNASALVVIRKNPEGLEIGLEEHVGLLDSHEPLDGGTVEHDLAVERLAELASGHFDVLVHAENVGELKAQEIHAELAAELEDVPLARTLHFGRKALQTRPLRRAARPRFDLSHA